MRVALAQINPVIGDVAGNAARVREYVARAEGLRAELVVFSEVCLIGYPARDLLDDPDLIAQNVAAVEEIARDCREVAALVGFVRPAAEGAGAPLEDAAALLAGGRVQGVHVKSLLPNYGAYDDPRYFRPGTGPQCSELGGRRFGVTICEDLWDAEALGRRLYAIDPIGRLATEGVGTIVNIAASGYERGKVARREGLLARQARRSGATIVYVNQVGANDGMIFDGGSCVLSPEGRMVARAASFRRDLLMVDVSADEAAGRCAPLDDEMTRLGEALKLGVRDYVEKGGYPGVVVGLAGDAGSVAVAVLAVEALGPERVRAVAVAAGQDADPALAQCKRLAERLCIELDVLPGGTVHDAMQGLFSYTSKLRAGGPEGAVLAWLRAGVLSILGRASRRLPLVPVNKTDLALGRAPAAFGVCGGLAPVGDLFERDILGLVEHLDGARSRVLRDMIEGWRASGGRYISHGGPPGPLDDEGPPALTTAQVEEVLSRRIEQGQTAEQIAGEGFGRAPVDRVLRQFERAEAVRRQGPTVLEVSSRAFGPGRRVPVVRKYV
jgi:NAD+ synthase (glutamine-hydrolysing)